MAQPFPREEQLGVSLMTFDQVEKEYKKNNPEPQEQDEPMIIGWKSTAGNC